MISGRQPFPVVYAIAIFKFAISRQVLRRSAGLYFESNAASSPG
jgi:hypothetical protein